MIQDFNSIYYIGQANGVDEMEEAQQKCDGKENRLFPLSPFFKSFPLHPLQPVNKYIELIWLVYPSVCYF